jgi:hypothetical protein
MPCDDEIDQAIRVNKLRAAPREAARGEMVIWEADDIPPDILPEDISSANSLCSSGNTAPSRANVVVVESAPLTTNLQQLEKIGVDVPPPDKLDDRQLHAKLWEVIHGLARLRTFLTSTNHLSDRQLYGLLWGDLLRHEVENLPSDAGWTCHLDILGGCSDEDLQLRLKYYADEADREIWQMEFPDDRIPPHEDPPYDRDAKLPSY